MSLASTSTLKAQLKASLGPNSDRYFSVLSQFICGLLSRVEFEEAVRQHLTTQHLLQLHNALVISLFDASSHQRPRSPPPGSPTRHQRKRLRIWPYQGPGENEGPRSSRLKRWVVGVGRKERDRTRSLQNAPSVSARLDRGEIARERAIVVLPERSEPSGSRLPLTLSTMSRSLNIQHIFDRMNLISAQWNLGTPQKNVAPLLLLALEVRNLSSSSRMFLLTLLLGQAKTIDNPCVYTNLFLTGHLLYHHLCPTHTIHAFSFVLRHIIHNLPRHPSQSICGRHALARRGSHA
jgi:hypothetical protein